MLKKRYLKSKDRRKVTFYAAPVLDADRYLPNPFDGDNSVIEV